MKHLRQLRYLLLHKWYVFIMCWKMGVPILGAIHDLSKFLPDEWFPYAEKFFSKGAPKRSGHPRDYEDFPAVALHIRRNKHHWQFWTYIDNYGIIEPVDIPIKYLKEMVADWYSANKLNHGEGVQRWYQKHWRSLIITNNTRRNLDEIIFKYIEE